MDHRTLGCTSLKISELCLGTMHFGWNTDEPTSLAILDAYHAAGGNFIQGLSLCSDSGQAPSLTAFSESVVGQWIRSRGIRRETLVLGTQVNPTGGGDLSAAEAAALIRRCCEASLARLGTDYLDVLVCRWPQEGGIAELRRTVNAIIRGGLARYVVLANVPASRAVATLGESYRHCDSRFSGIQADYSLLARTSLEPELAHVCADYRLGFLARSPLAGGVLGGSVALRRSRRRWLAVRYGVDLRARVACVVSEIARERGCSPAQIALAWVLHHPRVTSAITGVASVAHLDELVSATRVELSPAELDLLHAASSVQHVAVPDWREPAPTAAPVAVEPAALREAPRARVTLSSCHPARRPGPKP